MHGTGIPRFSGAAGSLGVPSVLHQREQNSGYFYLRNHPEHPRRVPFPVVLLRPLHCSFLLFNIFHVVHISFVPDNGSAVLFFICLELLPLQLLILLVFNFNLREFGSSLCL